MKRELTPEQQRRADQERDADYFGCSLDPDTEPIGALLLWGAGIAGVAVVVFIALTWMGRNRGWW